MCVWGWGTALPTSGWLCGGWEGNSRGSCGGPTASSGGAPALRDCRHSSWHWRPSTTPCLEMETTGLYREGNTTFSNALSEQSTVRQRESALLGVVPCRTSDPLRVLVATASAPTLPPGLLLNLILRREDSLCILQAWPRK